MFPTLIVVIEVVACVFSMVMGGDRPDYFFQEGRIITLLNSGQLALCSIFAFAIYVLRIKVYKCNWSQVFCWLLVCVGSAYLSIDEVMQFHETNGTLFSFLRNELALAIPNKLTVRDVNIVSVGDLFQCTYGLVVIIVCVYYRQELFRLKKPSAFYAFGCAFLLLSAIMDVGQFSVLLSGAEKYNYYALAIEDSCKFVGFGFVLAGLIQTLLSYKVDKVEKDSFE